jgi:LmbE family N-acetylglucosaminyl deacetylase
MRRALVLLFALAVAPPAAPAWQGSDPDPAGLGDRGAAARHQALLDLTNPFTVMCVACHPDDEDGATLTLERRKHGARAVTLFATSGEGGQNAVGPELYEELGRIRERETREASAIQGSEPYFLRLRDFGFSKSGDEAMRVWEEQAGGHERLVEMFVAAIRRLKPDVIITNHDTKTGHGQHQATGRLLVEAFPLAGDASRFPNAGPAWAPKALYVRARPDSQEGTALDVAAYDPVRGLTYQEQAFRALLRHATQGPWKLQNAPQVRRYVAVFPAPAGPGAGIGSPLTSGLAAPAGVFYIGPDETRESNREALIAKLSAEAARLDQSRIPTEVDAALAALFGASFELRLGAGEVAPGATVTPVLVLANGGPAPLEIARIASSAHGLEPAGDQAEVDAAGEPLAPGASRYLRGRALVGDVTPPPAERPDARAGTAANVRDMGSPVERDLGARSATVAYTVAVRAADAAFLLGAVEHVRVTPFLRLTTVARPGDARPEAQDASAARRVSARGAVPVSVRVKNLSAATATFHFEQAPGVGGTLAPGEERVYEVSAAPGTSLRAIGGLAGGNGEGLLAAATVQPLVTGVNVPPGLRVGYVRSYEYSIPEALERLGVAHRDLPPEAIRDGDLSQFDTIVIDNRAYLKHPDLARYNARLLEYVANGGNVVVFYHKDDEYDASLAPYPIKVGRGRITDENAPVEVLAPSHPAFNFPNKIGPADFEGWVQERGLYFPESWDARYTPLLSSHDPGEKPLTGGLLVARHGKGTFVYTSYVWYRQLRGLVPGGHRIFANLISLPKAPG